jgi:hypothetical protein
VVVTAVVVVALVDDDVVLEDAGVAVDAWVVVAPETAEAADAGVDDPCV